MEEEWEEVSLIGAVSVEASCWSRLGCVEVESDILREGRKEGTAERAVMEESIY